MPNLIETDSWGFGVLGFCKVELHLWEFRVKSGILDSYSC